MSTIYRLGRTGRDVWNNRVAETPGRPFLNFQERRWTYREADAEIRSIKSALYEIGLRQGDSIVVGMANSAATLFTQFAVRQLGAVLIPMVPDLGLSEVGYQVGHSEARFMIADDPLASLVAENRDQFPGLQTIVAVGPVRAQMTHGTVQLSALPTDGPGRDFEPVGVTGDTLSEIVYTSGSTARPKGVMLPAGAFVNGAFGYAERFEIGPDDSYLLPFTFGHATASIIGSGIPLFAGGQLTIVDRFSPSQFWSQVERYKITKVLLFPAQINLLLDASETPPKGTSTLDLVITHEWINDFWEKSGIPMVTTWGQTETGASGAGSPVGFRGDKGQGYIGRAYPDAELAAFDEAGERCGPGVAGELRLRHPYAMLGYLKDPVQTAAATTDGWINTGDIGYVDADGGVFYVGRIKNMIKRSGYNISPAEIEVELSSHPDVSEAQVFGVPDDLRKEEVAAVVVVHPGRHCECRDLQDFLAARLSKNKLPRFLKIVHEPLPRLTVGKIDRNSVIRAHEITTFWDARTPAKAH